MMSSINSILSTLQITEETAIQSTNSGDWCINQPEADIGTFYYVLSGDCIVYDEKTKSYIKLETGHYILFPFGNPHYLMSKKGNDLSSAVDIFSQQKTFPSNTLYNQNRTTFIAATFKLESWTKNILNVFLTPCHLFQSDTSHTISLLLHLISVELKSNQNGSTACVASLIQCLLLNLIRRIYEETTTECNCFSALKDRQLQKVITAIHKQPDFYWTIEQFAQLANLSRAAFSRKFKLVMQQTPMDYLNEFRINLACVKLENTQEQITNISEGLGFNSADVFIRNFKKYKQLTPENYRLLYSKSSIA